MFVMYMIKVCADIKIYITKKAQNEPQERSKLTQIQLIFIYSFWQLTGSSI